MTDKDILALSAQYGTINDFGKTFFTDDELLEFVHSLLSAAPPQPQTVKDALEKAADIAFESRFKKVDSYLTALDICGEIRALIEKD